MFPCWRDIRVVMLLIEISTNPVNMHWIPSMIADGPDQQVADGHYVRSHRKSCSASKQASTPMPSMTSPGAPKNTMGFFWDMNPTIEFRTLKPWAIGFLLEVPFRS